MIFLDKKAGIMESGIEKDEKKQHKSFGKKTVMGGNCRISQHLGTITIAQIHARICAKKFPQQLRDTCSDMAMS
jgi:hypothetical protein